MANMANRKYFDFSAAIALDDTGGNSVQNIFGYQTAATTAFRALWGKTATYVFPPAVQQMQIKSTQSADTMQVLLIGLDANYDAIQDTVTLAGTAVQTTTASFFRINTAIILTGSNAGTIDIGNDLGGSATFYKTILPGNGRCQESFYTVPRNHCFLLYRIDAFSADSTAGKPAIFRNYVSNAAGRVLNVARTTFADNMHIQRQMPFKYDEKSDIQFQAATASGSHEIAVFGEGVLHNLTQV